MNIEDKIAGMCLYGFIRGESKTEQKRCLREIKSHYGENIAEIVERFLRTE